MPKYCCLCGLSKGDNKTLSLFAIPKTKTERENWSRNFKKKIPENGFICSRHFNDTIQIKHKRRILLNKENFMFTADKTKAYVPDDNENISVNQCFFPDAKIQVPNTTKILNLLQPTTSINNSGSLFQSFINNLNIVLLPPKWAFHKMEKYIVYSKLKETSMPSIQVEKSVTIDEALNTFININGVKVTYPEFKTIESLTSLQELIIKIENETFITNQNKYIKKKLNYKNKIAYQKKKKIQLEIVVAKIRKTTFNKNKLYSFTQDLPDIQKELVHACVESSQKNKHGVRYTLNWVYSCILMRIKSPKLYEHIRREKIMPLPCHTSLLRYIKKIDGNFGFKPELFKVIKEKTKMMSVWETHGSLLIDECKISPSKHFNKNNMELFGFVHLGSHTPKKDENELGNHALVFMFQPFAGRGIQALACFLTKGNVTGNVQAKLVLECILLCENAGLHIDVLTSDGATWNRSMWKTFGITDMLQPWCIHPENDQRLLQVASDFPHLVKCLRNLLISRKQFHVPEGIVKHSHFDALVVHEASQEFRIAYKLTNKHIWPKNFEKMSTKLAFQLFSNSVAIALNAYKNEVSGLKDSGPTVQFCQRINKIIDIMNSSSPLKSLRKDSDQFKELENFLVYLDLWEQSSPPEYFLSNSTFDGFKATIPCTLNLVEYLTKEIGFKYLMTTRINQDNLEHFFGMMRSAGGCNSHPESLQVGQIFRLMSIYSLVKPPRGSNVSGGHMLKTLLSMENIQQNPEKKKMELTFNIVVDNDTSLLTEAFTDCKEAFAYLCGFLAKKFKNISCPDCKMNIVGHGSESFNKIITEKSRGFLTYPSELLYNFLIDVEVVVSQIFKNELEKNALMMITEAINNHKFKYLLGCPLHCEDLTQEILHNFIILRLTLTCQKEGRKRNSSRKSKQYAKLAKLQ